MELDDRSSDDVDPYLRSVTGDIFQSLKHLHHPPTPLPFFDATCKSLYELLSSDSEPSDHHIHALITIISNLLPTLSFTVIKNKLKTDYLSDLFTRLIQSTHVTDSVVVSGLTCISHLLVTGRWDDVSQLFGVLLEFIADSRLEVRRQAHACLLDVMQSFKETPVLSHASEAIVSTFERFLRLAAGSNADPKEASRAQDVLYVLDSLKDTLPLMSLKSSTKILIYFKSLLELHHSGVTGRITDAVYLLCLQSTVNVSPDALIDLLCALATSVSSNEMSGDSLTFTARLLDVGMKKVFSLNRQTCIVKLPFVFNALTDILASEHEEPLYVAMEALKSLIHTCIDERCVQQGVDMRRSAPTVIEKLCASVESLLDYRYAAVWDMSFQIVAAMFDKLGELSSYFLQFPLKILEGIQKLPDEDFLYRKQLHDCIGVAVVALGPETFLKFLPLNVEAEDTSDANTWLFPILKRNIVAARLSFFNESLLHTIRVLKSKSAQHEQEGRIRSARIVDGLVYSLWYLLPSFCNYPVDTATSFKDLEKEVCDALREETDLRGVICTSLQLLIQQNKRIVKGENENEPSSGKETSISQQRAVSRYSPEVAACNLDVLRSSAHELLSTLSQIFIKSSKDDGGSLQKTIREFASIADKGVASKLFKKAKKGASTSMEIYNLSETSLLLTRARLYDLAVAFLPGLDREEVDRLFVAVESALKDTDSLIQKKAYKLFSAILEHDDSLIKGRFEELLKLMAEVTPSCHFSAKRYRLNCLNFLIAHVLKDKSQQVKHETVASFLTEIVLGLKESNKKTRNTAYEIIVQIGHACIDEDKGGNKDTLCNYFNMVALGLAGTTPHMISAAMEGISRLTYEFTGLLSNAFRVLPTTFHLLQRNNTEINKACLGFLKVLIAKSQAEELKTHMRDIVEAPLSWQNRNKNHLKAMVRLLLKMLVTKCGFDAVKEVMPEEHMKLLTNIRKVKERKERKSAAANTEEETKSRLSEATTSRMSRWNHTKIFSDEESFGGNFDVMDTETASGRYGLLNSEKSALRWKRGRKRLVEDSYEQLNDEPLDLLDRQRTRSCLKSSYGLKRKRVDEPEIDSYGRIVVREDETAFKRGNNTPAGSSRKAEKRRKMSESRTGSSKKADGGLRMQGKLEPYAYWPLDRKMVSRKPQHRAAAMKGMSKRLEVSIKGLKLTRSKNKNNHKKLG